MSCYLLTRRPGGTLSSKAVSVHDALGLIDGIALHDRIALRIYGLAPTEVFSQLERIAYSAASATLPLSASTYLFVC